MSSPSRNVQYHPPRLSEDRLNLPQPHSPTALLREIGNAPRATRIVQPSAKQQFAEPVPAPLPIRACVITSPAQVAHRFLGRRRRPHLGQQPRPMQFRQLARVPPVGLDPLPRLARHQRRRDHLALDPAPLELPLQYIAARPGFVTAGDGTRYGLLQLAAQPFHRPRLVLYLPGDGSGGIRRQQRHVQLHLVRIDSHVGDRLAHDRLLSSAALTPRSVSTRES